MNLSKYIITYMNAHGHTIESFSFECNVSYSTLYAWLNGVRYPNIFQVIDLIDALSRVSKTTRSYQQKRVINLLREDKIDYEKNNK